MMVKTKIGVLVKLQDKNQSKSERKLSKNGFSTNKMQTKKHLFSRFLTFYLYISKKSCTFARYLREDARSILYITQNKLYIQHKTNTEYKQ